ncbi:hypothetical protein D3C73_1373630 [compost metagenome]
MLKAHVETQRSARTNELKDSLLMLSIEAGVLAVGVREVRQIDCVGGVEWTVGDFFNEVGQLEVHVLFVFQGQRVAFAAEFDDK